MIETTAVSLILALTALLQESLSCPGEVCIKPDGYVVYYNDSEGQFDYYQNFTSFTKEFPSPSNVIHIPMIPIGHDGAISLSECRCQSNFYVKKCCSINSTMDAYTGRCMDEEIVMVKEKRRRMSTYDGGGSRAPCFGTCSAGDELLIASLRGSMHFIFKFGELCMIHENKPVCLYPGSFCIDYISSARSLAVASCRRATKRLNFKHEWGFSEVNDSIIYRILVVALLISILSLTVTFLVYSCFCELRNMHGKCLLCHIASFIVHDALLISRKHIHDERDNDPGWICVAMDIVDYIFYLAPFSWMNVICFDILMSFMNLRLRHANNQKAERMKFALYSMYSWTTPLIAYLTSFIIHLMSPYNIAYIFHYNNLDYPWCALGGYYLAKNRKYAISVYLVISVILFIMTAIKIYRINASTSILRREERVQRREENENKHSFKIYTKLLVVMGFISWVIEPIHYVAWKRPDYIFTNRHITLGYAADFFRCLQGLYISVFLLWNDKIINLVKEKLLISRVRTIQPCFPQPRNVKPLSRPELSSQASRNPLCSVVTVTTCQGSQERISESAYMASKNRESVSDFNVWTGKPAEDTLTDTSPSVGGISCPSLMIPVGDSNEHVSFSTASPGHEMSHL